MNKLSPNQYHICREGGTETPFSGKFIKMKKPGVYVCVACGASLFSSNTKYDSGTGWPSFWDVVDKANVKLLDDYSLGMPRSEVRCANCDSHLGHVFKDGPRDTTGLRYCINSAALNFNQQKNE